MATSQSPEPKAPRRPDQCGRRTVPHIFQMPDYRRLENRNWPVLVPKRLSNSNRSTRYGRGVQRPHNCAVESQPRKFWRMAGKLGYLHAAKVIEVARLIGVINNAISIASHLAPDVAEMRQEPVPLRGDSGFRPTVILLAKSEYQQCFALHKAWQSQWCNCRLFHPNRLLKFDIVDVSPPANFFRRHAKMLAKSPSEGFMRSITGVKRDRKYVRRAVRQLTGGLAQAARADVSGKRIARRNIKGAQR